MNQFGIFFFTVCITLGLNSQTNKSCDLARVSGTKLTKMKVSGCKCYNVVYNVVTLTLSHVSSHVIINFFSNFLYNFLTFKMN